MAPAYPPPPAPGPPVYPMPAGAPPASAAAPGIALQAAGPEPAQEPPGKWGAGLDLGISGILPDLGLLATWRPYPWLHAQLGPGFNVISPGLRCGATVINPWFFPISLTGEIGHYFEGDANGMVKSLTGQSSDIAILRKVSYDYANALVGFTSSGRHFVFYFRAGVTTMRATVNNFQETVSKLGGTTMETSDARLSYYGPTVKFGMIALY